MKYLLTSSMIASVMVINKSTSKQGNHRAMLSTVLSTTFAHVFSALITGILIKTMLVSVLVWSVLINKSLLLANIFLPPQISARRRKQILFNLLRDEAVYFYGALLPVCVGCGVASYKWRIIIISIYIVLLLLLCARMWNVTHRSPSRGKTYLAVILVGLSTYISTISIERVVDYFFFGNSS